MKFVISFIFTSNVVAAPITIYHEMTAKKALVVQEIFMSNYKIPHELISIRNIEKCSDIKNSGKIDLCLKNNGDLLVVSVDRRFINESLKIFQAP